MQMIEPSRRVVPPAIRVLCVAELMHVFGQFESVVTFSGLRRKPPLNLPTMRRFGREHEPPPHVSRMADS